MSKTVDRRRRFPTRAPRVTIQSLHFGGQTQCSMLRPVRSGNSLASIVVEAGVVRQAHEAEEFVAAEHGHALARVEDERDAGGGKVAGVLSMPSRPSGRRCR